jgi:hypothetical protein
MDNQNPRVLVLLDKPNFHLGSQFAGFEVAQFGSYYLFEAGCIL